MIRAQASTPNNPPMVLVDITKVSFTTPPASRFVLPAACAGVKPPPTADELIAAETGDDPANWVNGDLRPWLRELHAPSLSASSLQNDDSDQPQIPGRD